jgi:hypothetical protein
MKDVQATGEAFRPQKEKSRTPALQNMKFLHFFQFLGLFWPPGFGSAFLMWIQIEPTKNQFGPGSTTLDDSQQYDAISRRATTRPYCIVIAKEEAFFFQRVIQRYRTGSTYFKHLRLADK